MNIYIFRFDTKVHVDLPDVKGRQELIEHYLSKLHNVGQIDSKFWARKTIKFSGADIENMVNTAAINAAVKGMQVCNRSKSVVKIDSHFDSKDDSQYDSKCT